MGKLLLQTLGLLAIGFLFYLVHYFFILPSFQKVNPEFLNFSYSYNFIATAIILFHLLIIGMFSNEYHGFLFLTFGAIKLVIFVFLVQKFGYNLQRHMFLHIFFPYVMGVGIELFFTIRILNTPNLIKTK